MAQLLGEARFDLEFLAAHPDHLVVDILRNLEYSRSQRCQDLFALAQTEFKRGGFFVEFGASDGVEGSNTWLLEKRFAWRGILAEPARTWHQALETNRDCAIDQRSVWSRSRETIRFIETDSPQLSTIESFAAGDRHAPERAAGRVYDVPTVSLSDLLEQHSAPDEIDYLSIDTEGSEYAILSAFEFNRRYRISTITCEHNHTSNRKLICELMTQAGYRRVFEELSGVDDWYILDEAAEV